MYDPIRNEKGNFPWLGSLYSSHDKKMATEPLNVEELQKGLSQVVVEPKPRRVYEVGKPYNEGWLKVSDLHEIYFYEMGKEDGKPVIYL